MDLDDIKAQLDRIFAAGNRTASRDQTDGLRQALVQFKVGIGELRDALVRTERELATARHERDDYQRRGALAARIDDQETVRVAAEFAAKAGERIDLLERKVIVQRDELAMAEREYEATRQQFQQASRGVPLDAAQSIAVPPDQAVLDQQAREAAVEAQLAHLKRKLGGTT
jgi:hypothetical protein